LQGQIFLDWYKFMIARYNDPPAPQTTDVLNYVQLEISLLTQLAQDGETLTKAVSSLAAEIAEALPSGLTLAQVPADRFYAPADPVVLMTGDGVPSRPVDNAATIACELITDMASALNLPAGLVANSDAINLPCNVLPAPASGLPSPVDTAAALLQSDFLITPATAAAVTAAVAQLGGAGNPALLDFDTAAGAIAAAQRAFSNGSAPTNGISLLGSVPEPNIAYAPWSLPWSPVALSWRHIFYPTAPLQNHASKYAADVISDKFALSETSLNYLTDAPPVLNAFSVMTGTALLSSDATISVQSQVAQYLKYHTDAELQKIQADLGDSPVIAQSLSGFTAGMIMKTQALQLSIGDPCAEDPVGGSFSNQQVPAAVGGQNQFAPYATYPVFSEDPQFNAFRAGVVTLTDLILIDSFGRFQTVDTSNLIVADSFQPGPSANQWVLPPRISQPCQLKMTWLSGADASLPATGSAATNPICGWIVPNDLDDSLMYYNGDGTSIGSQTATAAGILWQAAPGAGAFSQTMAQSFGAHNTTLYAFAQAVAANGPSYLTGLLRTTSETRTLVSPASYQADRQAAVLIGTPLVLVQASLQLRAQGPLAPDQGFPALEADYARTGSPLRRTTHGLERIAFPVLLGQEISLDDGLIGFFLGSPGHAANFTTCYANKADGSCPDIVAPTTQTLQLTLGDAAPTLVAMLIDPRCSVHAFTGVNPVGALSLQSELYAQALSSLSFTFLASPVLAPAGAFAFPVPKESDGVWSWVVNSAGAWVEGAVATPSTTPTLQRSSGLQEGWLKLSPRKRGN
jgi:hypothetical protein